MKAVKRYFGTDGIRGRVGEGVIVPEFMLKLGWAAGRVFAQQGKQRILIGKDTRISGYMFESALEAGLSAAGVDSLLVGPMPTPAIAYLAKTFHADAGIVISASHNPYYDNGVKFFSAEGTKLPDDMELAIEAELDKPIETVESKALGKAVRINDAGGRYVEFCKSTAQHIDLSQLTLVLDCAHGATYDVAPKVFRELGARVHVIANEPDGLNINQQVGSTSPSRLQSSVLDLKADLGIAYDGDGDRLIMVDHHGELVDGDELLYIIARHAKQSGLLKEGDGVVGTLMTNLGLELALRKLSIPLVRAQVGDRYVMQQLLAHSWLLGGENSGHIVLRHLTSTGDGIVSSLQVLKALQAMNLNLFDAKSAMHKLPQVMINVPCNTRVDDVMQVEAIHLAVQQAQQVLQDTGRVLLRPSGTEPVVRVMVEGEDLSLVREQCKSLAQAVEAALA